MDNKETAKRLLRHYLSLGKRLDADCLTEIDGIVDHIVVAAKDEMAGPLTTKPAPLQAPDPAMTLGAAAEPDAPLLGVLLPDGKWAELTNGQLHAGYNPHLAQAVADNHGGTVRAFNEGRGDE